jgi:hypothetical protein
MIWLLGSDERGGSAQAGGGSGGDGFVHTAGKVTLTALTGVSEPSLNRSGLATTCAWPAVVLTTTAASARRAVSTLGGRSRRVGAMVPLDPTVSTLPTVSQSVGSIQFNCGIRSFVYTISSPMHKCEQK